MRCGYLAGSEGGSSPWSPEVGEQLSTCAGYTTELPDVRDIAAAYLHWQTGGADELRELCGGESPPRPLLDGVVMLKGAFNQFEGFKLRKASRGGGG